MDVTAFGISVLTINIYAHFVNSTTDRNKWVYQVEVIKMLNIVTFEYVKFKLPAHLEV